MDEARLAGGGELVELAVHLGPAGVGAGGGIEGADLGVVQRVVEFAAELKFESLPDGEVFEDGDIPVVNAGAA